MLGARIRELREAKRLTQGQLATKVTKYVPLDRAYLSQLETGGIKDPSAKLLIAIARGLNVDPDVLFQAAGYIPPSGEGVKLEERRTPREIIRELEEVMPILVPETSQPASAGPGVLAEAEYWPYSPGLEERRHQFIAVPVEGSCMEPRLHEGERVIVDKDGSPRPGDIVIAIHNGETLIKELQKRDGELYLVALRDRPPRKVTDETRIIGVVRMVMHRP